MVAAVSLLAQSDSGGGGAAVVLVVLAWLVLLALFLIGYWKVFEKLGLPGWMGIVPFVNIYQIFKVRGRRDPALWTILSIIPCISIVAAWFLADDTADLFDKELGWKLLLFFIPGLSHLGLGFGEAQPNRAKIAPGVGLNAGPA